MPPKPTIASEQCQHQSWFFLPWNRCTCNTSNRRSGEDRRALRAAGVVTAVLNYSDTRAQRCGPFQRVPRSQAPPACAMQKRLERYHTLYGEEPGVHAPIRAGSSVHESGVTAAS